MLPPDEFDALVEEALDKLPHYFQQKMQNVAVLTAVWPSAQQLKRSRVPKGYLLLGLYQGVPLTRRTQGYNLVAPDTITLFQGPIETVAGRDTAAIRKQVQHTVIHELAHHFGISDDRLRELGAY